MRSRTEDRKKKSMNNLQTLLPRLASCALLAKYCALTLSLLSSVSLATPGDIDTTFGAGSGKVITPIGSESSGYAVAVQPDRKLVVTGDCIGTNTHFCLSRYLPDGSLDAGFNGTGKVIVPLGVGQASARGIALQPDGKIVSVGNCYNGINYDFCLTRHLSDGLLDDSFNGTGKVISEIGDGGSNDYAYSVVLQPDGKIVVAGECSNGSGWRFCVARYLPNGSFDASFNSNGRNATQIGGISDGARSVALQSDGKIVVTGHCYNANYSDLCLARYLPNGLLDFSFNGVGTVVTSFGGRSVGNSVAVQPNGKVIVAGSCDAAIGTDFCITRYLANGTLDVAFNGTGKVTAPFGTSENATSFALQPDGKIVVAGYCYRSSNFDFCLARYLADGSLDTSFNATGRVSTAFSAGHDYGYSLALQTDGKIVVAGACRNGSHFDVCIARYEGGPFDSQNCKLDIDGDGLFVATKDALILTRIALGITGPAVISGISFAPHATRNTWPLIRDYLVTQCGMSLSQ
jgi:uncharacterized delta-60 repeat protein